MPCKLITWYCYWHDTIVSQSNNGDVMHSDSLCSNHINLIWNITINCTTDLCSCRPAVSYNDIWLSFHKENVYIVRMKISKHSRFLLEHLAHYKETWHTARDGPSQITVEYFSSVDIPYLNHTAGCLFWLPWRTPSPVTIWRCHLTSIGMLLIKISRSIDRLNSYHENFYTTRKQGLFEYLGKLAVSLNLISKLNWLACVILMSVHSGCYIVYQEISEKMHLTYNKTF